MNYARIVDGVVAEIIQWPPTGRYPEDWVWVDCPADTQQGATYDGTDFTNPVVPDPVDPDPVDSEYQALSKLEFVILVQAAANVDDAKLVTAYEDPNLKALWMKLDWVTDGIHRDSPVLSGALDALVATSYIDAAGKDAILATWPQS